MKDFIKQFTNKNWYFEFVLQENGFDVNKILFYSKNEKNNIKIKSFMYENIKLKKENFSNLNMIFSIFSWKILHFWFDKNTNRYKIYIWLYNESFENSLKIISEIKKCLWLNKQYFLEKDFTKFDCLWLDISEDWIELKIYELVNLDIHLEWLPDFIQKEDVKEIWYLKTFSWRKKKFFRFKNYQEINIFKEFDLSWLDSFQEKIKDFYILKKKVKYYCIEWDKKELYII